MDPRKGACAAAVVAVAALAALLVAGCNLFGDEETAGRVPASGTLITYERSGGIAALSEWLHVSGDGRTVVSIGTRNGTAAGRRVGKFELSRAETERIRATADAAHLDQLSGPGEVGCADCFVYTIRYKGTRVSRDESAMPRRMGALVALLSGIVADHSDVAKPIHRGE